MSFTPIKILRSLLYNKRPIASGPNKLLDGQPAVNYNPDQPGLFFRNSDNELFKVGPTAIGEYPPNSTEDPEGAGTGTNCLGELWLDIASPDGPTLKVWDGSGWVKSEPLVYAKALVSASKPSGTYPEGTLWWNSNNGLTYTFYQGVWIQLGSTPVTTYP